MNQHQFPPCFRAILFIRLKVPPSRDEVDVKASFCRVQTSVISPYVVHRDGPGVKQVQDRTAAYHGSQLHVGLSNFIADPDGDLM